MERAIALLVRLVAAAEEAVRASYRNRHVVAVLLGRANPTVASVAVNAIPRLAPAAGFNRAAVRVVLGALAVCR